MTGGHAAGTGVDADAMEGQGPSDPSRPGGAGLDDRMRGDDAGTGEQGGEQGDLGLPSICRGCSQETLDTMDMTVHLHHVHLNVADRERSVQFYQRFFDAKRVRLNGVADALHVSPTLLLLDELSPPPKGHLPTALQHMGWGATDPAAWYEAAHKMGIGPDTRGFTQFNTNETPTVGDPGSGAVIALFGDVPACFPVPDVASYMYVLGPDEERIEVWSGADGRVNHVHFTTPDLAATARWYQDFLGLPETPAPFNAFFLDDILFFFEPIGEEDQYEPTDNHVLSHIAFSVTDLGAWRTRASEQGVTVVAEPASTAGFMSFFVRGPDGLLVELVQAAPARELCPNP
ncbi:MAG: VOC family protein [Myxococcales bacterium]|nr:VOC family protein [Myxococcales bacterium]MDD9967229.1 VOC family protein [Myxococcales bacterium]